MGLLRFIGDYTNILFSFCVFLRIVLNYSYASFLATSSVDLAKPDFVFWGSFVKTKFQKNDRQ